MAERRMFAKTIIDSDQFLDMPLSTQSLYFHLSMRADDDGFVNNPKKIMRMIGSSQDELDILLAKRFILSFDSGVIVIKHWRLHNSIRKDRYKSTNYQNEMKQLGLNEVGVYTEIERSVNLVEDENTDNDIPEWLENRKKAMEESDLPYSFAYKVREHFYGSDCPVCGNPMVKGNHQLSKYGDISTHDPTIQHNKPISKGGKHELGNISVICESCNKSLRNKETGDLNAQEVTEFWKNTCTQSATNRQPIVDTGKDRLDKYSIDKNREKEEAPSAADKPHNGESLDLVPQEEKKDKKGLSILKDDIAQYWQEKLTTIQPHSTWSNYGKERKACGDLARRTRGLIQDVPYDSPEKLVDDVLGMFLQLKKTASQDYWARAPATPSAILTRWSVLTAELARKWQSAQEAERYNVEVQF